MVAFRWDQYLYQCEIIGSGELILWATRYNLLSVWLYRTLSDLTTNLYESVTGMDTVCSCAWAPAPTSHLVHRTQLKDPEYGKLSVKCQFVMMSNAGPSTNWSLFPLRFWNPRLDGRYWVGSSAPCWREGRRPKGMHEQREACHDNWMHPKCIQALNM